ncbi:MAG: hypothetical protein ABUT20_40210 [Bacteroidota bacterium]
MDKYATSEYKITYLIGAGASAKALPVVKGSKDVVGIYDALQVYSDELQKKVGTLIPQRMEYATAMVKDLKWLADQTQKFGTPDTYAKFLYLKDPKKLATLKRALSFFFIGRQLIDNMLDDRILIFLTSILQYQNIFPSNIKILNWNYDIQFQLASENFSIEEFQVGDVFSHKAGLLDYYPSMGQELNVNYDQRDFSSTSMVHLNGIAGSNFKQGVILHDFLINKPTNLNDMIERFEKSTDNDDLITFAWEDNKFLANRALRKRMEIAKSIVQGTDILVIIGYSFPFFNRTIDKQIFDAIKEENKLKKIVYQDPVRTGEFLKRQFELADNLTIEHFPYTDNYFIPHEL